MEAWWIMLTGTQKILWGLAIFSTTIFTLQMVLTFLGLDGHGDTDFHHEFGAGHSGDVGHDSGHDHTHEDGARSFLGYFTLRSMIAFFLGFSWGGIVYIEKGIPVEWAIVLALLTGITFSATVLILMKGLSKLRHDGTMVLEKAIGKEATVSIRIPAEMVGAGKVSISFQGRLTELEALTRQEEIRRGQKVKVVATFGNQLVVEKL